MKTAIITAVLVLFSTAAFADGSTWFNSYTNNYGNQKNTTEYGTLNGKTYNSNTWETQIGDSTFSNTNINIGNKSINCSQNCFMGSCTTTCR